MAGVCGGDRYILQKAMIMKKILIFVFLACLGGMGYAHIITGIYYHDVNPKGKTSKPDKSGSAAYLQSMLNTSDSTILKFIYDDVNARYQFYLGAPGSKDAMKLVAKNKTYALRRGMAGMHNPANHIDHAQPIPWGETLDSRYMFFSLEFDRLPDDTTTFDIIEGTSVKESSTTFTMKGVKPDTSIKGVFNGLGKTLKVFMNEDKTPWVSSDIDQPMIDAIRQHFTPAQITAAQQARLDKNKRAIASGREFGPDYKALIIGKMLLGADSVQAFEPVVFKDIRSIPISQMSGQDLMLEYMVLFPNGKNIDTVRARLKKAIDYR